MNTACRPLNAKQANDSARNSCTANTPVTVVRKSDRWIAWVGVDSVSIWPCSGSSSRAKHAHAPALISIVPRQPMCCASSGPSEPPRSIPAGIAVCVIENANGAYRLTASAGMLGLPRDARGGVHLAEESL